MLCLCLLCFCFVVYIFCYVCVLLCLWLLRLYFGVFMLCFVYCRYVYVSSCFGDSFLVTPKGIRYAISQHYRKRCFALDHLVLWSFHLLYMLVVICCSLLFCLLCLCFHVWFEMLMFVRFVLKG